MLLGFLHLYADPAALPPPFDGADTEIALHNPHTARSVLAVDGAPIGEVPPRGTVCLRGLAPGGHVATWTTPAGFTRPAGLSVPTAPPPTGSSRPCAR
ncbi:MAG: hypothetical protein R3F59_36300 [Myxococcota bacterium]